MTTPTTKTAISHPRKRWRASTATLGNKHNGKREDGRHDDKLPHGSKHNGKHDKDGEYHFRLVETDREFTYDENGRLLSSKEQEENSGLSTYEYTYDAVGNRLSYAKKTQTTKHPNKTDVAESAFYQYNDSNQLVSAKLFDGKKSTTVTYTYDENGSLIMARTRWKRTTIIR